MAILPVRRLPDPVLKDATKPVETITPSTRRLVDDLIQTMRHHPRCVGLAAPQVGVSLAVAVVDVSQHPKATGGSGLMVCINPKIVGRQGSAIQREGCLSIPDLTGNTQRSVRVQVTALDESGKAWTRWFEGFEAIAMQHEVDHLDGKLFLDRIANLRTDVFRRKRYF